MRARASLVVVVALAALAAGLVGCVVRDPAFGARCGDDVDCRGDLRCVEGVCLPVDGVDGGADPGDAGPEPDAGTEPTDAGPEPTDAGPDPTDAGPEPVVFLRAPRAFGTTMVVAAGGTATVTLQGSDPDGDPLTFSLVDSVDLVDVTVNGAVATVVVGTVPGSFRFRVGDGALEDVATVQVRLATPDDDLNTTVFIGTSGDSWNDASKWSRGIPGNGFFNARVPAGKVVVVQAAPSPLSLLQVDSGAVVDLGAFSLSTTELHVGGEVRCTLAPCLRATRIAGDLPSLASESGRFIGPTIVRGRLTMGFDVVVDAHNVTVLGPAEIQNGGFLTQTGAVLHTEAAFTMGGSMVLSGGVWSLRGSLVRTRGQFSSTGTHRLLLDAAAGDTQTVALAEAGCPNDVDVQGEVALGAETRVCGRLTVRGGATLGGATLDVTGPITLEEGGRLEVPVLRPRGGLTVAGDGFAVPVVQLVAGLTVPELPYQDLVVTGSGTVSLDRDIAVGGTLGAIDGEPIELDLGEATLSAATVALPAPARLRMIFPDARLVVAGDMTLAPNNGGTMTHGVVEVGGNLRFDNGSNARYGGDQHTWRLTGSNRTVTSLPGSLLVGRLEVAAGASVSIVGASGSLLFEPTTALLIDGTLTIPAGTTLRLTNSTEVRCGADGAVVLEGACELNGAACAPLCP